MALIPQIDNSIAIDTNDNEIQLPSKTYKLTSNMTSPLIVSTEEIPVSYEGNEFSFTDATNFTDLKIYGNTEQTQYEGYQLFDKDNVNMRSMSASEIHAGATGTFYSATNQKHIYIKCKASTQYTVVKDNSIADTVLGVYETEEIPNTGKSYRTLYFTSYSSGKVTVTTSENAQYLDIRLNTGSITTKQLEEIFDSLLIYEGNEKKSYEPYTGEIPAPNPEYPQEIQVVKGNNVIRIRSNNGTQHAYSISLATAQYELYKLSDEYQDEIYKQDDKWYIKKVIKKLVFDGTESWSYNEPNNYFSLTNIGPVRNLTQSALSNKYIFDDRNSGYATLINNRFAFQVYNNKLNIFIKDNRFTNVEDFKNDLANINLVAYYVLETPVIEEITNTLLINQLNIISNLTFNNNEIYTLDVIETGHSIKNLHIDAIKKQIVAYQRSLNSSISFDIIDNDLFVTKDDDTVEFEINNGNIYIISNDEEELTKYFIQGNYMMYEGEAGSGYESDRILGYVDKLEAIKQSIYHILMTERYAYLIYSNNYGVELEQYIGKDLTYIEATIEDTLREALTYDLRILDIEINSIDKINSDSVLINFTARTIYGDLVLEVNINV